MLKQYFNLQEIADRMADDSRSHPHYTLLDGIPDEDPVLKSVWRKMGRIYCKLTKEERAIIEISDGERYGYGPYPY